MIALVDAVVVIALEVAPVVMTVVTGVREAGPVVETGSLA